MKLLKKDAITNTVALVAGGIGANFVNTKTAGFITNPKLRAAAPLVLGLFMASQKSKMIQKAGEGMIAVGGQKLIGALIPGLAGIDADDVIEGLYDEDEMNGTNDVLNGTNDVINGYDDDDFGDE